MISREIESKDYQQHKNYENHYICSVPCHEGVRECNDLNPYVLLDLMETEKEVIGTFLYAASPRNYEVFRLIFTPDKVIVVSLSWKKKNAFASLLEISYWFLVFPFEGPGFGTVLMRRWLILKDENREKPPVSYDSLELEDISKMSA